MRGEGVAKEARMADDVSESRPSAYRAAVTRDLVEEMSHRAGVVVRTLGRTGYPALCASSEC